MKKYNECSFYGIDPYDELSVESLGGFSLYLEKYNLYLAQRSDETFVEFKERVNKELNKVV